MKLIKTLFYFKPLKKYFYRSIFLPIYLFFVQDDLFEKSQESMYLSSFLKFKVQIRHRLKVFRLTCIFFFKLIDVRGNIKPFKTPKKYTHDGKLATPPLD